MIRGLITLDKKKKTRKKKGWKYQQHGKKLLERLDDLTSPDDIEIGDGLSEEDILQGKDREH